MNQELYHFGVKGMKWGVRRYQKKDGTLTRAGKRHKAQQEFDRDVEKRKAALDTEAARLYKKSTMNKMYKKIPKDVAPDDWDGWDAYDESKDTYGNRAGELRTKSHALSKDYVKTTAVGYGALSAGLLSAPTMYIASSVTKSLGVKGAKRAGIVLASGLGTTAVSALAGAVDASKQRREALRSEGIKSVRERVKEMN